MDNRLKEIVDNFDSLKIGVDEPFRFHCTMCGKCCINREDILLTPRDIYCMAKELQISPEELFKRYCETYSFQNILDNISITTLPTMVKHHSIRIV